MEDERILEAKFTEIVGLDNAYGNFNTEQKERVILNSMIIDLFTNVETATLKELFKFSKTGVVIDGRHEITRAITITLK